MLIPSQRYYKLEFAKKNLGSGKVGCYNFNLKLKQKHVSVQNSKSHFSMNKDSIKLKLAPQQALVMVNQWSKFQVNRMNTTDFRAICCRVIGVFQKIPKVKL